MYIHVGQNTVIPEKSIIGVFDMDNTTTSKITRAFLENVERRGGIVNVSDELPKAFVVTTEKVYLTQLAAATIARRRNMFSSG
jgi:hypothetical protein